MNHFYNLTHENEYYASCLEPSSLPETNYTFVEITYHLEKEKILSVKGIRNIEGLEKECILSGIDLSIYMEKLNIFLTQDIDRDKIHLNFVETDTENRIQKIFIILLASYLIYFNFLEFPFNISTDLLSNKMLKYFTEFTPLKTNETSYMEQVSLFHRYFSTLFENTETETNADLNMVNDTKTNIDLNMVNNKIEEMKKDLEAVMNSRIDKIALEIKEYKRKLLADVNNKISSKKKDDNNSQK
tara:strand:- start:938 stop:1666 length:729 start_codon:yes stop_codon:yes gene_type:complete